MKEYVVLAPIVLLIVLGAFIALRSGANAGPVAGRLETGDGGIRMVAGNFSALLLRLVGFLALMLAFQSFLKFPSVFTW